MFFQFGFPSVKYFRFGLIFQFVSATQESLVVLAARLSNTDTEGGLNDFGTRHFGLGVGEA